MTAIDISPVEVIEEKVYDFVITFATAGIASCLLLILHTAVFHGTVSLMFVGLCVAFFCLAWLSLFWKAKRFGERDGTVLERIVRLERKVLMGAKNESD